MSWKMVSNRVFNKGSERGLITSSSMNLEASKANKTRRHTAHDGPLFQRLVPVVEHVAHHRFTSRAQREGTGGGYAQVVHGFAAKKLTDRGSQHRFSVCKARIRCVTCSFELQFERAKRSVEFA